jgi:hypothetical protein
MMNTKKSIHRGSRPSGSSTARQTTKHRQLDHVVENVFKSLVLDLTEEGSRERQFGLAKLSNPRVAPSFSYEGADAHTYKVCAQLEHFHKRVILKTDTPYEELERRCLDDFVQSQLNFGFRTSDRSTELVLNRTRTIVAGILGSFSFEDFSRHCAFGRRAALGLRQSNAYLDERVKRLTGTQGQLEWFKAVRAVDVHLLRATRPLVKRVELVDTIGIQSVPKSHKAVRIVAPDTVVGGFLSRGAGSYIRECLEASTHIDLAKQQHRHKVWAREGSLRGHLATIDMSKASDSFTIEHVKAMLPEDWWPLVEVCRLKKYSLPDKRTGDLRSVMLMGSGITFPLQTLLFYALSKAVCDLTRTRGIVSCYGDDIIMPNNAARPFAWVMEKLGFTINRDKSFWDQPEKSFLGQIRAVFFRESCGGDYHRGVDVRPYMPEILDMKASGNEYFAFLHRTINGLLERWHALEIPRTVDYLLGLLRNGAYGITFVPDGLPAEAGLPISHAMWLTLDTRDVFPRVVNGVTRYKCLTVKPKSRTIPQGEARAHYWYWLWRSRRSHVLADLYASDSVASFGKEASRDGSVKYRWTKA